MSVVAKDDSLQIERLALGPYSTNTYIVTCRETADSIVVDAPGEAAEVLKRLEATHPKYILMTHNHMDHIDALADLKSALKVPLAAHRDDAGELPVKAERLLTDGDTVSFGKIQLQVLHTPGHTPGSLCFLTGDYLISGDTLFPGGPGKTWSAAAFKQILASLKEKIFILPDETKVYPGHGEATLLGKEKQAFAAFSAQAHDANLYGDVTW